MRYKYNIKYDISQIVFLKTDRDQLERFVTGIDIRPSGITYRLSCETIESWHYEFEISEERDVIKATTN